MRKQKTNSLLYLFMNQRLNGEQAYMASVVLEAALRALWREYGDDMANFQGRVFLDDPSAFAELHCYQTQGKSGEDDF